MKSLAFIIFLKVFYLLAVTNGSAFAAQLRTVAITGMQAPGNASNVTLNSFDNVVIGASGQVAFRSFLSGPGIDTTNNFGIFAETATGNLRNVSQTGDQAPGLDEGAFLSRLTSGTLRVDGTGKVSFAAEWQTEEPLINNNNSVLYSEAGGQGLRVIAREGGLAPGTNREFNHLSSSAHLHPYLSPTGFAAFFAQLRPFSRDRYGIWIDRGKNTELVVLDGGALPGLTAGTTIELLTPSLPFAINPAGNIAFQGFLCPCSASLYKQSALLVQDGPSGFRLAATYSEQAPGLEQGVSLGRFGGLAGSARENSLGYNKLGETAFFSTLLGSGVTEANDNSLWSEAGGQLHLLAREGDQAPGFSEDLFFSRFGDNDLTGSVSLSDSGHHVFFAPLRYARDDPNAMDVRVLWSEDPDHGLRPLIVSGDRAPGTEQETVFGDFFAGGVNSRGRYFIFGNLSGPNVTESNNIGIWTGFDRDSLELIARKGDSIEVAPDDRRTIANFGNSTFLGFYFSTGVSDGRPAGFNDNGQAAFLVRFTDGSEGVFVVPEPPTAALLASTIMLVGLRRHGYKP